MANKLLAKMKKEKAFLDVLSTEHKEAEWLSTNCISVNLLLSGKIQGRYQERLYKHALCR